MTDILLDGHSSDVAPWPCDCGARVQTTTNRAGRMIRAKWRKCLGDCGVWFWSEDAANHRMCSICTRGYQRTITRPPSEQPLKERATPKPPRPRPKLRPVIAEGQRYPSIAAVARTLGVAPRAIRQRIKRGWRGYRYAD